MAHISGEVGTDAQLTNASSKASRIYADLDLFFQKKNSNSDLRYNDFEGNGKEATQKTSPAIWGKVGRNSQCPCGSGKKYKNCHGKN